MLLFLFLLDKECVINYLLGQRYEDTCKHYKYFHCSEDLPSTYKVHYTIARGKTPVLCVTALYAAFLQVTVVIFALLLSITRTQTLKGMLYRI